MRDKLNQGKHRENRAKGFSFSLEFLSVLCGKCFSILIIGVLFTGSAFAWIEDRQPITREKRSRYDIRLAINFDERTYTGTEQVHWVNHGDHATSTIFFHLYPNMRPPDYIAPTQKNDAGQIAADEPRIEITEVRAADNKSAVSFSLDDMQTTLRLNLREPIQREAASDLQIKVKASVANSDPEESGIVAHVLEQVSAAIRSEGEL